MKRKKMKASKELKAKAKSYRVANPELAQAMREIRRSSKAGTIETGWRKRPRSFNKASAIRDSLKEG